ncbi:MAG: serine/threonine-protein kinase [Balneolales bacterium]|nr:serine/threonine-protein kinase [Balneolales bacterium]
MDKNNETNWDQVFNILDEVLTLDKEKQLTYLQQNYGDDEPLMQEVRKLLFSLSESDDRGFMSVAEKNSEQHARLLRDIKEAFTGDFGNAGTPGQLTGSNIGPYKLRELIGRGGMGYVYKAERSDDSFEQTVAIKLMPGQFSETKASRFRQERNILANLDHPNIGRLFDGGVCEDGSPYLIMEYVDGIDIVRYCCENKLSLNERLSLFGQVVDAIQYAHSNFIVHRDIKPSNVMVNKAGQVKVLDFGIAKMLSDDLQSPELTFTGQKLFTPYYAAPEQILEKPIRVQTDVYALGLLLSNMLCGKLPYSFENKSLHETEKLILESDPALPGQLLSDHSEIDIRERYGMSKSELLRELNRDINYIVAKALRKEPESRYLSAVSLGEDLERYRINRPIRAKAGSRMYRFSKYLHRNKTVVSITAFLIVAIIGMVSYYTIQLEQERSLAEHERSLAEKESAKSRQIADFMVSIFDSANSYTQDNAALGLNASIGSILDFSIASMDEKLGEQPEVKARISLTLSKMFLRLGELERAEQLSAQSTSLLSDLPLDSRRELANSLFELGRVYQERGNIAAADSVLQESISLYMQLPEGSTGYEAIRAISFYGNFQWFNLGNFELADSLLTETLHNRITYHGHMPNYVAVGYNDLAAMQHSRGFFREASYNYEKAIDMYQEALGSHPAVGVAMSNYSILLREYLRLEDAAHFQNSALRIFLDQLGDVNIDTGLSYGNLSNINYLKGNIPLADSLMNLSNEILIGIYGEIHPYIARNKLIVAQICAAQDDYACADSTFNSALRDYREIFPPNHPRMADPYFHAGSFYLDTGNADKAYPLLKQAYNIRKEGFTLQNWRTAIAMSAYGEAMANIGNYTEAQTILGKSLDVLSNEFGNEHLYTQQTLQRLAAAK